METNKVKYDITAAHQRYFLQDGTEVPGVTTVLGIISKPQLIHWAWEQGRQGQDYRKVRDQAASIGSIAHWLIECKIKGQEPDLSDFAPNNVERAKNAFNKFIKWAEEKRIEFESSELQLVSEKLRFGGTLDIIAKIKNKPVLIDIKTSKSIYEEYWHQVAAYGMLYKENFGIKIKSFIICRIGKEAETSDFETQERSDVKNNEAIFNAALNLYYAIKSAKR